MIFSLYLSLKKSFMNKPNNSLINKTVAHPNHLITVVVAILMAFCILATCSKSYAQAFPRSGYIHHICPGSLLGLRSPFEQREGVLTGARLVSGGNALFVGAGNMAYIGFKDVTGKLIDNKFVQVGPHSMDTYYSFPCTISGYSNFALSFQHGNTTSCKNAVAKNQLRPCPRR
jgi:hypothetical protein